MATVDRHAAWRVIELSVCSGRLWAHGIGHGLTQAQALTHVREAVVGPRRAVACGSPHVLTITARLNVASAGPSASRLAAWLTDYLIGLRAKGLLALGELRAGASIPLGWIARLPRPLARYFEGVETIWGEDFEGLLEMDQRRRDAVDMMERVEPMSVAGLLRATPSWDPFLEWVAVRAALDRIDVLRRSLVGAWQRSELETSPASIEHARNAVATCTIDPDGERMREVGCRALFSTVWCGGPYRLGAGFPALALLVAENRSVMLVPHWTYSSEDEAGTLLELLRADRRDPVFRGMARNRAVSVEIVPLRQAERLGDVLWHWAAPGPHSLPPRRVISDLVDALLGSVMRLQKGVHAALDLDALEASPGLQGC